MNSVSSLQKVQTDMETINIGLIAINYNIDTLKQVSYLKHLIKCAGFFLSFVYVCIAIGNQVIKRGGLGSH